MMSLVTDETRKKQENLKNYDFFGIIQREIIEEN